MLFSLDLFPLNHFCNGYQDYLIKWFDLPVYNGSINEWGEYTSFSNRNGVDVPSVSSMLYMLGFIAQNV